MPRRRDSKETRWGGWQGEDIAFEKEMRKARYSERQRPPREFRDSKKNRLRPDKKRKSRSKEYSDRDTLSDDF